jgi:hypothetical protein
MLKHIVTYKIIIKFLLMYEIRVGIINFLLSSGRATVEVLRHTFNTPKHE